MRASQRHEQGTHYGLPYGEQARVFLENAWQHERAAKEDDPSVRALIGIGFALLALEHAIAVSREAAVPGPAGMLPKLYGGGRYRKPNRCDCGKIPYRDEAAALTAASHRGEDAGVLLSVYKCPGSTTWHLTSRGFRPESLKTRPRIVAWHIATCGVTSYAGLYRKLGLSPEPDADLNVKSKVRKILHAFTDLGLIARDVPRSHYITATNRDGLRRVMQVGLEEYADSRGASVIRRPS